MREGAGGGMIGRTLNHYKIVDKIGAGGMGEVYAAEDTRLRRRVALKVLPPSVADSPERRARFEREATAIASLNHPNIVTIHSVEADGGTAFITMELVEGRPLSEVIPPKGLPVRRFFDLAVPLADALAAAHRAGVVHRDLKPDNVVVGEEGRLKILDFGLAKLGDREESSPERSSLPTRHLTGQGQVMGTVAYMSPEQVEGKALDHRTDIFSLGIVLYEMATGRRPFHGDTPASIISSILRDTPRSVTDLNRGLPRHLGRILRQCLAKDPEERTQSAQDVRNQLVDLRREMDSGALEATGAAGAAAPARGGRGLLVAAAAGAIALAALAFVLLRAGRASRDGSAGGAAPRGTQAKLTDLSGQEVTPSLAPDGRSFVYAGRASGNWDIYAQRVGGSNVVNLTADSPDDDIEPAFSPDGERIAFVSSREGGGIFVMGATGESVVRVTDFGYRPSWSPDGRRLAFASADFISPFARPSVSDLWIADVATGETRRLYDGDAVQPAWSPNGSRIAFWGLPHGGGQRDLATIPVEGGEAVPVTSDPALDWNPAWSPDGRHLYFSSNRGGSMNVWRVSIDEDSGRTLREPEAVTSGVASDIHSVSVARDGRRLVFVASVEFSGLRRIGLDERAVTASVDPAALFRGSSPIDWPELSPDGRFVAFVTIGAGEKPGMLREDIVVASVDGTSRRVVAPSDSRNRMPRWSPAEDRIAFASDRSGTYRIYTVRPDGSDLRLVDETQEDAIYPVWSPSGDRIAYTHNARPFRTVVAPWPPSGKAAEEIPRLPEEGSNFVPMDWSPDGRILAGHRERAGGDLGGIVVYGFDTGRYERLTERGVAPHWLSDSRRLLYTDIDADKLFVLDVESRQVREIVPGLREGIDRFNVSVSRDGRTVMLVESDEEADLWLLDLE